jgi:hypothetical protein
MCDGCLKAYTDKRSLMRHISKNKANDSSDVLDCSKYMRETLDPLENVYQNEDEAFSCLRCTFASPSNDVTIQHFMDEHHNDLAKYLCTKCHVTRSDTQIKAIEHWKNCNGGTKKESKFTCLICDFGTSSKETLKRHMKTAHGSDKGCICKYGCREKFDSPR